MMKRVRHKKFLINQQYSLFTGTAMFFMLVAMLALNLSQIPQAFAQASEIEPNDSCSEAQDFGFINVPFVVDGSLDIPPDIPDVDFFKFSATAGDRFIADLEGQDTAKGTLSNPFLGLFDSTCNRLDINDDFQSLNSSLEFVVPTDGVFILAASSCCDGSFTGDGGSSGTYRLTILPPPPSMGSITGRVVDAVSGEPLSGSSPPYAYVELLGCNGDECLFLNGQGTDSGGRFFFDRDSDNRSLSVGSYQVLAYASGYQDGKTDLFKVDEGEDFNVGDIALNPPAMTISDIQPCAELPSQGGTCLYSVRIHNNTNGYLYGMAWSLVEGFNLGSELDYTMFEATTNRAFQLFAIRRRIYLQPFSDTVLRFQFKVPSFVNDGSGFCTRVFVGLDPYPLVNTVEDEYLFCTYKRETGFQVMSESKSQEIFQSLRQKARMFPGAPALKRQ